jgi:acyl transferase domain-containing protein
MGRGCVTFLEIGPQPVLSALTLGNSDGIEGIEVQQSLVCLPSIRRQDPNNWPTMLSTLSKLYMQGVPINWKRFYQFSSKKIMTIPFYPFLNRPYWFEIPDRRSREFHPLVGKPLPNASELKLYSNLLNLEDSPYLLDHVIGSHVIFPGAGFVEMCLVAGHAATHCTEGGYFHTVSPITIENFVIETPLGLEVEDLAHLQVIVSSEDSGGKQIEIDSKSILDKDTHKWNRHATCTFSPFSGQ